MNTRTAIALLFASASAVFSLSATAQDQRYDPRYNQDYRNPPPAYAPPPVPMAVPATVFQDNARVLRVSPRVEQVSSPQEECHMEIERGAPVQSGGQGRSRQAEDGAGAGKQQGNGGSGVHVRSLESVSGAAGSVTAR